MPVPLFRFYSARLVPFVIPPRKTRKGMHPYVSDGVARSDESKCGQASSTFGEGSTAILLAFGFLGSLTLLADLFFSFVFISKFVLKYSEQMWRAA